MIAHHTVYEKTPNLQQSHVCQCGAQPHLVGPLSRLVGKPPFSPGLSKNVLPLTKAANGPNSAISMTQTFDHILFYVCNSRYFGVQNAKNGDRGTIVSTATLNIQNTLVHLAHAFPKVTPFGYAKKKKLDHGNSSIPWSRPSTNSRPVTAKMAFSPREKSIPGNSTDHLDLF